MIGRIKEDSQGNKYVEKLAGLNADTIPLGAIQDVYAETEVPRGWLECDGSTFDTSEYPDLYLLLGSNKLPRISSKASLSTLPDYSGGYRTNGYIPDSMTKFTSGGIVTLLHDAGVGFADDGMKEDGILQFYCAVWAYIWIQDGETGEVYSVGQVPYTDSEQGLVTLHLKKGSKIYALGRSSTAQPTGGDYYSGINFCYLSIFYYNKLAIIKAVSGIPATQSDVVTNLFNNVKTYVDANTPIYTYDSSTETLTITQRGV